MKRLAQSITLLLASTGAMAEPIFHPAGENLGAGPVSNVQTLISHTNNPATGASALDVTGKGFGFGLVPSVGMGFEFGPVGNLVSQAEEMEKQLNAFNSAPSAELADEISEEFNAFLEEAGRSGYVNLHLGLNPIAPIVWNSVDILGGSLVLDINASAQAQVSILDSPIVYNPLAEDTEALETASALYVKAAAVTEFGLGYSRKIYEIGGGSLYAGVRGKLYQATLRKTLAGVSQFGDINALLKDEAEIEITGDTAFGVDLGVIWASNWFRAGATFKNLNAPSFSYKDVGTNCEGLSGASADSCYLAYSFKDRIDLQENWVMDPQVNLEFAFYNKARTWFMASTVDASPVNDPTGNEMQWLTVSAGYATRHVLAPGFRVGYRKNLAGSELSAVTAGLSLFRIIHLDLAWGLETVPLDEPIEGMKELPRMAQLNLGIDFLF